MLSIRKVAFLYILLLVPCPARAHEGPPFPILTDQHVGPYLVSVWTDPDIGIGTFFVVLEPVNGKDMPTPDRVQVSVVPVSGRLPVATYAAEPQEVRYGARYYAEVPFDQQDIWTVRILIDGHSVDELTAEVESTPDGTIGPISLIIYLLPFLGIGFLWWKAFLKRRSRVA